MVKPTYVGIDQSIKETVVTVLTTPSNYKSYSFKGKGKDQLAKIQSIWQGIKKIRDFDGKKEIKAAYIEGGSFKSQGQLFSLGQLSGGILQILSGLSIPATQISPSELKKFTTGRGACSKQHMMDQIRERFGQDFRNDNYADSYALAIMAYYVFNYNEMPNKNRPSKETAYSHQPHKKDKQKNPTMRYRRRKDEF